MTQPRAFKRPLLGVLVTLLCAVGLAPALLAGLLLTEDATAASASVAARHEIHAADKPVVRIVTRDPSGRAQICSGFLVGPQTVATAAHCTDPDRSYQIQVQIRTAPGGFRTASEVCTAVLAKVDPDYEGTLSAPDFGDDFAVLLVNSCQDRTPMVGDRAGYFVLGDDLTGSLTSQGYPGDVESGSLWESTGELYAGTVPDRIRRAVFQHGSDAVWLTTHVFPGNSGGVVFNASGEAVGTTVGLQVASGLASVRAFDEDSLDELGSWLAEIDPTSANAR